MSILALTSDTLIGTAAAGNIEYNGQFFGTDSAASRAQMQRIVRATAVASTSGTSIDFTGIPAWVKRITVMFAGVSQNSATQNLIVQLGDSGGIENTSYVSVVGYFGSTNSAASTSATAGFAFAFVQSNTDVWNGLMTLCLVGSNTWVASSMGGTVAAGAFGYGGGGSKTLSDTLDRVRITTVGGTATFDAGSINILYEG